MYEGLTRRTHHDLPGLDRAAHDSVDWAIFPSCILVDHACPTTDQHVRGNLFVQITDRARSEYNVLQTRAHAWYSIT